MFSLAKQEEPKVEQEAPKSEYYLRLKTKSNGVFLGICFGIGVVATNIIRLFPDYYLLYVLVSVLSIALLLAFPLADTDAKYLWRWGAVALLGGLALPWWELIYFVPKWVWGVIGLGVVAILWVIGGGS
jgi:hypothetical protein